MLPSLRYPHQMCRQHRKMPWKCCNLPSEGRTRSPLDGDPEGRGNGAMRWFPPRNKHFPPAPNKRDSQVCSKQFIVFFVRQTHWFLDHSRGWKPFTNLFIWKYKYKIILSTSVMWETPIHIVFYNRALESHTQRPERCLIYIDTYIYVYI